MDSKCEKKCHCGRIKIFKVCGTGRPGPPGPPGLTGLTGSSGPQGPQGPSSSSSSCVEIRSHTISGDIYLTTAGDSLGTPIMRGDIGAGLVISGDPFTNLTQVLTGEGVILINHQNLSIVFGYHSPGPVITGNLSVALGIDCVSSGYLSFSGGERCVSSGKGSFVWGTNSVASGDFSEVFGDGNVASGTGSRCFGINSVASGYGSLSNGTNCVSSGHESQASGINAHATSDWAFARGQDTIASGFFSNASGISTIASGLGSQSTGISSVASGVNSEVYGAFCSAVAPASFARGYRVTIPAGGDGISATGFNFTARTGYVDPPTPFGHSLINSFQIGDTVPNFIFTADGNGYASGSFNNGFSDLAEFYEISSSWLADGLSKRDRYALFVTVEAWTGKIKLAHNNDEVEGITSSKPSFLMDCANFEWHGKYLRDELGFTIMIPSYIERLRLIITNNVITETPGIIAILNLPDDINVFTQFGLLITNKTITFSIGGIIAFGNPKYEILYDKLVVDFANATPMMVGKLNPDFDPDLTYSSRSARPEWIGVGLVGKLRIKEKTAGCCTGSSRCDCEDGYAIPGVKYLILNRVNDNIITVKLK